MSNEQVIHPDDQQWNPPGGELTLDDLFPNPEVTPQQSQPVTQTQPPAAPEYFLKASTGTVYKTPEDAVRGTEEKDRTILAQKAELDRLRNSHAPSTPEPPQADFAETAFDKLAAAAQKGDKRAYIQALAEVQMATLSQFAPALTGVYEQQAISSLESEVKDFRSWLNSPDYTRTLEQFPQLANAIQVAKSDPRASNQLGEYYKLAYRAYAGDPHRINDTQTQMVRDSVPSAPTPTRPTLQSSTPTPTPSGLPQNVGAPYTREQILSNRATRQEFLKRYAAERNTSLDKSFGELGL